MIRGAPRLSISLSRTMLAQSSAAPAYRPFLRHTYRTLPVVARAASGGPGMRSFEAPATGAASSSSQPAEASSTSQGPRATAPVSPYRVSLFDALRFAGPAPEKINGRISMLAFPLLVRAEMETGETILQQAAHPSWGVLAFMAVIVYASLVPIQKGAIEEPFGIFTPSAERWNGRMAMLALAVLISLEYKTGFAFF